MLVVIFSHKNIGFPDKCIENAPAVVGSRGFVVETGAFVVESGLNNIEFAASVVDFGASVVKSGGGDIGFFVFAVEIYGPVVGFFVFVVDFGCFTAGYLEADVTMQQSGGTPGKLSGLPLAGKISVVELFGCVVVKYGPRGYSGGGISWFVSTVDLTPESGSSMVIN